MEHLEHLRRNRFNNRWINYHRRDLFPRLHFHLLRAPSSAVRIAFNNRQIESSHELHHPPYPRRSAVERELYWLIKVRSWQLLAKAFNSLTAGRESVDAEASDWNINRATIASSHSPFQPSSEFFQSDERTVRQLMQQWKLWGYLKVMSLIKVFYKKSIEFDEIWWKKWVLFFFAANVVFFKVFESFFELSRCILLVIEFNVLKNSIQMI